MELRVIAFSLFVFWMTIGQSCQQENDKKSRHKRSVILLPQNTSITITFDLSMPVAALRSQSAFYNMRVPFRFFIPTYNQLTSYYGRTESREDDEDNEIEQVYRQEQERANEERRFIYKSFESLLSSFGIDGMACVQRAICELSEAPIGHNDLFGNTLSLLFTPPTVADFGKWIMGRFSSKANQSEVESHCDGCEVIDDKNYHDEYATAYYHGKQGDCLSRYESQCPISFFKIFDL